MKLKTGTPKGEELCAVFDGGEVELLLYVFEDFEIAMDNLEILKDNYTLRKKYFKKVLGHGPAEKITKVILGGFFVDTVVMNTVTVTAFEKLKRAFIKLYCTSTDPKGDLIKYLKTEKCKKPKDKSVSDHQDRVEEMMRYATFLEGARNDLSDNEKKTILFITFPEAWQMNYQRSQPSV